MRLGLISLFGAALLLTGCSSASSSNSYYLLNSYSAAGNASQGQIALNQGVEPSEKTNVGLTVQLAEYLNSPYLVMQINQHKLSYASFHMWAEPLADETLKALQLDLNAISKTLKFVPEAEALQANELAQLSIEIDYFYVTAQSKVVLAGRYQYHNKLEMEGKAKGRQAIEQTFTFEEPLEADGYSQSVTQMRSLLLKLAKQVAVNIER
ncbi:PqiC family protein [Shewanella halifaxensis]|nr:ABC-type transport auxiliary lipoprotein family protein [Shewanella halifaxensis]